MLLAIGSSPLMVERMQRRMPSQSHEIEIREVGGEEYIEIGRAIADYAFGASPRERDVELARRNLPFGERTRNLVAFVDGRPQASLVSHEMTQNLRGSVIETGGVGAVASLPAGRRRGIVRRMFEQVFEMYRDREVPISTLYPFRDSFYERLGYAGLPKPRFLTLKPETLAPLARLDTPGSCEQVSMQDGFDEWRAFLERYQLRNHGFVLKHITYARQLQDQNELWVALARHDGDVVGAMTFKITGYGEQLIADTFYAIDSIGRYQLLDMIGRHTDQVKEAIIELRPDDLPELWFRDLGARVSCGTDSGYAWPAPMGRVIDVTGLRAITSGPGKLTLDIEDSMCPWNNGRFTFRSENGQLEVVSGGTDAEGCLAIQGLSALVFCGHDPADFSFRGWGDLGPETQATLRSLFPPAVPDIHEKF